MNAATLNRPLGRHRSAALGDLRKIVAAYLAGDGGGGELTARGLVCRRGARVASACAFLLLAGLTSLAEAAPADAGQVLTMAGQCFVQAGGRARIPLKTGDIVRVGDILEAPAGARLKLRMIDGSVVSAGSNSRLTIRSYASGAGGRDARLVLDTGLLRAVVTPVRQPSRFEVDTATSVAAVRSTDWFIEAKPQTTQVGVLAGKVELTSHATGADVSIPARWGARVDMGRDPVPARVWTAAEFADVIARTNIDSAQ